MENNLVIITTFFYLHKNYDITNKCRDTNCVLCLFWVAVWSIDSSKSCRNNYQGIWTFVHTLYEQQKGRLRAAGENGLQDISTLLPGLIGFIDFLVVLPWRPCLPWKRINIPPFVRNEMRIDGHRNLVNGLVSLSDLCFRWILYIGDFAFRESFYDLLQKSIVWTYVMIYAFY